jgi:pseudouridine synthase
MFPVGRLDKETSGLLLFTNDVQWGEMISSPERHVPKTYEVTVDRPVDDRDLDVMRRGMTLEDGTALQPVDAQRRPGGGHTIILTLTEGKNRQVRRMMEYFRYEVKGLVRTEIGPITLKGLAPAQTRVITPDERKSIVDATTKEMI